MLNTPVSRRSFTRWAAASPLALAASTKSWAKWDNVETPPVFETIAPPAISQSLRARCFFLRAK